MRSRRMLVGKLRIGQSCLILRLFCFVLFFGYFYWSVTALQSYVSFCCTVKCISYLLCLAAQSCLTLYDSMNCSPPGFSVLGDSPGKNTGVGCHALLQGTFPTQGLNPGLPNCRRILYRLRHQGICMHISHPSWTPLSHPSGHSSQGSSLSSIVILCTCVLAQSLSCAL